MGRKNLKKIPGWHKHGFAFQLLKSHLVVASIGFIMLFFALVSNGYLHSKVLALAENGGPIAQASSKILADVQRSLADVRGWVSLGDKIFLKDWEQTWAEEIEPSVFILQTHGIFLEKAGIKNLMDQLLPLLVELKESQWWVNNVAQTPGNEPAKVLYRFEVEPVVNSIEQIIVSMAAQSKKERSLAVTEGIFDLFNADYYFFLSFLHLEKIIFQGSLSLEKECWNNWNKALAIIKGMAVHGSIKCAEHKRLLNLFRHEAKAFKKLADRAINLRKSDQWNMAQYFMASETVPAARQVIEVLDQLSFNANKFMQDESLESSRAIKIILAILGVLAFVMILIAFSVSRSRAIALTNPIFALAVSVRRFAKGHVQQDMPIIRDDEIGELTRAFNFMQRSVNKAKNELERMNRLLEKRVNERTVELNILNKGLRHEIDQHINTQKELETSREQIKDSLKEKEVLLGEIHHRVKNNMQVIISLLRLQSGKTEDKKFADLLKESENRVLSMALVHEQLYQTGDFTKINFAEYINDLTTDLFILHGTDTSAIKLHIDNKGVFLDIETAIPCGLIVNELISNCLKYAFADGRNGKIDISIILLNQEEFELIIKDNGVGIPKSLDIENTKSMGLNLVKVLAEETLEGKMELDRARGTKFTFRLKKTKYKPRI
ncbi:MAG: ATP-binding protein [Desulfobacula sp.]|nr:ATP-binding protein [Desulfobacula sp.]